MIPASSPCGTPGNVNRDDPPSSLRPTGPASTRAPASVRAGSGSSPPSRSPTSDAPPPSSHRPPLSQKPGSRRSAPLVEILSPLPGPPDAPAPEPTAPPAPPAPERPVGLMAGVGAMIAVPLVLLVVALIYIPKLRSRASEPLFSAPAPVSSEADAAVPAGKVLLSGHVVDGEGEPVDGARVVVYQGSRAVRLTEQTTRGGGAYSFELDPGRFTLVADHDDKGMVASADLSLSAGATVRNLVLALGAVRTVRGRVVSAEDGSPVAGAALRVEGLNWLQRSATSDADGSYQIARVPGAEASLQVTAPGYKSATLKLRTPASAQEELVDVRLNRDLDVDGTVVDAEGKPVRATIVACEGKEPGQRLHSSPEGKFKLAREFARCSLVAYHDSFAPSEPVLSDGGSVTLRLKAGGAIAGLVVDESSSAVRSFYVGVESFVPTSGERASSRAVEPRNFDDEGGVFLFDRLAPGSYVLSVGSDGRSPVRSPPIEVRSGQTTRPVKIVLLRGGVVEGQILDEEKRSPLAAARVMFDMTSSVRREGVPPVMSDDAGHFRLEGAPAGPFSLRVEHDGYRSRIVAGLKVVSGQTLRQDVGLKASEGGAGLEFVGIGAGVEVGREGLAFRSIFEGSPAEKAGLRSGDLLRRIDGQSVEGLSMADAIQRLRGEKGSQVRLTVERPPNGDYVDATVTRGEIVR